MQNGCRWVDVVEHGEHFVDSNEIRHKVVLIWLISIFPFETCCRGGRSMLKSVTACWLSQCISICRTTFKDAHTREWIIQKSIYFFFSLES